MKYKKRVTVILDDKDLLQFSKNELNEEVKKRMCIFYLEGKIEILDLKARNIKYKGCPILDKMSNTRLN